MVPFCESYGLNEDSRQCQRHLGHLKKSVVGKTPAGRNIIDTLEIKKCVKGKTPAGRNNERRLEHLKKSVAGRRLRAAKY